MSNDPSSCAADELRIVRSRFAAVAEDWSLSDVEVARLLGTGLTALPACDTPLDVDAETRLRLVIEVARGLDRVFERTVLLAWLRDATDGEAPLDFMARGVAELRAMRAAAALRGQTA